MSAANADGSPTSVEAIVATIESLSHDGRGVTHVNGKAVFVEGALPGERVRFRTLRRYRRYDTAEATEIVHPSPDRRAPPCPHFGVCGGCSLQHLESTAQLRAKQTVLTEQLRRIGKVEPQRWLAPLTGPEWGYRRRARLGVRLVPKKGGVLVGFHERKRSHIADLDRCLVLDPVVSDWIPGLRRLVGQLSRPDRIPQIDVAAGDDARALVFHHLTPLTTDDKEKLRVFGELHRAQIYLQSGKPDTATALWPTPPTLLDYSLADGTRFQFRPIDFVQVNAGVNRQMVARTVDLLDVQPEDRVLDLFSGLGNFTLALARRAQQVLGIEGDPELVEGACRNAAANGVHNVEFRSANLYAETGASPWKDFMFDKLHLDPPRNGAIEVLKRLRQPLPRRIVYVSCYPATLARDSEYLAQALGYRLDAAGVMDMFPHTNHVESMALFERP